MDAPRVRKRPAGWSPPPWDTPSPSSSLGSLRGSVASWAAGSVLIEEDVNHNKKRQRLQSPTTTRLCPWENCEQRVEKSDDALFDHAVKDHITPLKGAEQREKQREKNGKRKEEKEDSDDESEVDPYSCRWPDCGMSLKRGAEGRKIEWLEEHLHSRHIPAAGRFRCAKCNEFRGKTKKIVEEHEKKCGKAERKKREPRASPLLFYHPADPRPPPPRKNTKPPVRPADCFQYAHVRAPKRHPLLADFDPMVDAHLRKTLLFKLKHHWNVRREFNRTWKDAVGSAWRKTRLPGEAYRFVVIDCEAEEKKREEMEKRREEAEIPFDDLPQSLDELFPPPPGYPTHQQLSKMGRKRAERAYRACCDVVLPQSAVVPAAAVAAAPQLQTLQSASATDAYGSVPYSPASMRSISKEP